MKQIIHLLYLFFFLLHAREGDEFDYAVRVPMPSQHAMKSALHQAVLNPAALRAISAENRHTLERIIQEIKNEKSGTNRLKTLEKKMRTIATGENELLDEVFQNISSNLHVLTQESVNIFDQLVPSTNLVHNYFALLVKFAGDERLRQVKNIFTQLRSLFKRSLKLRALELRHKTQQLISANNTKEALDFITKAQALLYHLKETDREAKRIYNELDRYQPTPFAREMKLLGTTAMGGK